MLTTSDTINKEFQEELFCERCLLENIPAPHYHVTYNQNKKYCPIHTNICDYCNSPNHSTHSCPYVKLRLLSTIKHKDSCVFKGKLIKKSSRLKKTNSNNQNKIDDMILSMNNLILKK